MKKFAILLGLLIQFGSLSAQVCEEYTSFPNRTGDDYIEFYTAHCPENSSNAERNKVKVFNQYNSNKIITCMMYFNTSYSYRYEFKANAESYSEPVTYYPPSTKGTISKLTRIEIIKVEDANHSRKVDLTPAKSQKNQEYINPYLNGR